MDVIILVIHLFLALALIGVVLIQRSDGGALGGLGGLGGGGGAGGLLSVRGAGNVLTRTTGILGAAFIGTSITLTILARISQPESIIQVEQPAPGRMAPLVPIGGEAPAPAPDAGATGATGATGESAAPPVSTDGAATIAPAPQPTTTPTTPPTP